MTEIVLATRLVDAAIGRAGARAGVVAVVALTRRRIVERAILVVVDGATSKQYDSDEAQQSKSLHTRLPISARPRGQRPAEARFEVSKQHASDKARAKRS